jgi:signal peptide peptidase SppA
MSKSQLDLTSRMINRPLLLDDNSADFIRATAMTDRVLIEDGRERASQMWLDVYSGISKPYQIIGSIAIIPVSGTLYNKVDWAGYSFTGYGYITGLLDYASRDKDVKGVILDIDSGGGEVDGAFETADKIAAFDKPIVTFATHAYSAAYLLGSAADKMFVTRTGGVGSIGVVTAHVDMSKMYTEFGVQVTLMYKGKHKVDGNSTQPLPDDVKARIEAKLEEPYALFVDAVAKNRSMESQSVRDTEALTYGADEAVRLGLVDGVSSLEDSVLSFEAELNGIKTGVKMSNEPSTVVKAEAGNEATQLNQHAVETAKNEGIKVGAESERTRIMGILESEESVGREKMALVLCKQGLSTAQAKEILASVPKAPVASTTSSFESAMSTTINPELSAQGSASVTTEKPAWQMAAEAYSLATGHKLNVN